MARALKDLPRTKESLRLGRISFSKARAIARLGTLEDEDEATIVEFAEKTTAPEVERLVRMQRTMDRGARQSGSVDGRAWEAVGPA